MRVNFKGILFAFFIIAILFAGCSAASEDPETAPEDETDVEQDEQTEAESDGEETEGELRIAINSQPTTLDPHMTTITVALEVARNIFETLVAPNEQYEPTPVLAESIDESDDGLTYTFHLREGVLFHNGEEMTSEDVVASMNRWLEQSSTARTLLEGATFEADGDYSVVLELPERMADVLDILAGLGQFAAIMPKEVVESATEEGIEEYIGTGPFKFDEWQQDQYVRLVKYDDYQSPEGEPSGLAGKKEALVEYVYYDIVQDHTTKLAGLGTGEYDVADTMAFDHYEQIKDDENIETHISYDNGTMNVFYNKKTGLMTDPKMRHAINAALDMEAVMLASYAHEDLYMINSSYMNVNQVHWASEAGSESYNQADPEKAKELLEEAGYNGEVLTILSTRDYDYHYNTAIVMKEELEQIGVNVELEIYDWPTVTEMRDDPENWDLLTVSLPHVTTPSQLLFLSPDYPGWTDDETVDELIASMRGAATQEDASEYWDELQGYLWNDYLPYTLFGHTSRIVATAKHLEGFRVFRGPIPWNTKVIE